MIHPARTIAFDELHAGLAEAVGQKFVRETKSADGLSLYVYTESCVYERQWTPITLLARGLVLDPAGKAVLATPFPKFFNAGEAQGAIPALPFETFEKLDGSLIVLWHDGKHWRCSTKGSFASGQAAWARAQLLGRDLSPLKPGTTYLCEAIYRANRIVVHYQEDALVLLAAYDEAGAEVSYETLCATAAALGWRCARRHGFDSVAALIAHAKGLPVTEEGFVLRFSNGLRLKVKGDEYLRIHALVSRLTPLAMWKAMQAGDDLGAVRKDLPEEFWADFDAIVRVLSGQIAAVQGRVRAEAEAVAHLSDKEVGLRLGGFPADVRPFIFPYRRSNGDLMQGRARDALFRALRPTGNRLDGYAPSFAMNRVAEEAH